MKILVISHLYPSSADPIFGIFVHQQVKELTKLSEVRVVSPTPFFPKILKLNKKWQKYSAIPKEELFEGVKVYRPRYLHLPGNLLFELYGLLYYFALFRLIDRIRKEFDFDIIHAHTAFPDGLTAEMIGRKYKKPVVVTVHGQDVSYTVQRSGICRAMVSRVFDKASVVIANSRRTADRIKFYKKSSKNIDILINGVDLKEIDSVRSGRQKMPGKTILLSVANLIDLKGIDYLIKALPAVIGVYPEIQYLIVGDGPERERLQKLTNALNLQKNVAFLGKKGRQETLQYFSDCDIFILPSWNEAFGLVYLEAMAFGKAVIGCEEQGIEDVLVNRKSGVLVKPKDVPSLESAILELISNAEYRHEIGDCGKRIVREKYTWGRYVNKLVKIYERALNK